MRPLPSVHYQSVDTFLLRLAIMLAQHSKDPSTKVGAVLTDQYGSIVSTGFNRFPAEHPDTLDFYHDRPYKLANIVHAEEWAFHFSDSPVNGGTLYTSFPTCPKCMSRAIEEGVARVVFPPLPRKDRPASWIEEWDKLIEVSLALAERKNITVSIIHHV